MIVFSSVTYLTSAASKKGWPISELPEVLLVGKSNVGKSSVINSIFRNRKLAYVGKTPGKTRLLNFFEVKDKFMLVDAPGYGFANRSHKELMEYGKMMEDYLGSRDHLKLIIWILDIRRTPNQDDLDMLDWFNDSNIPFICVLNKSDKLSNNQKNNQIKIISEKLDIDKGLLIPYSAKTLTYSELLIEKLSNL